MGFRKIPGSEEWIDVIPVHEGWSGDEKFRVACADGRQLLLANIPRAVDFGACQGGAYTLLSWVPGRSAEEVLPALAESEQAALGV